IDLVVSSKVPSGLQTCLMLDTASRQFLTCSTISVETTTSKLSRPNFRSISSALHTTSTPGPLTMSTPTYRLAPHALMMDLRLPFTSRDPASMTSFCLTSSGVKLLAPKMIQLLWHTGKPHCLETHLLLAKLKQILYCFCWEISAPDPADFPVSSSRSHGSREIRIFSLGVILASEFMGTSYTRLVSEKLQTIVTCAC